MSRSKASSLIFIIFLTFLPSILFAEFDLRDILGKVNFSNCGLDSVATVIALECGQLKTSEIELLGKFGGEHGEKSLSFNDISDMLASKGINSMSLGSVSTAESIAMLEDEMVLVPQLVSSSWFHFCVITKASQDQCYLLFDSHRKPRRLTANELANLLDKFSTGRTLVAGPKAALRRLQGAASSSVFATESAAKRGESQEDIPPFRNNEEPTIIEGESIRVPSAIPGPLWETGSEIESIDVAISNVGMSELQIKNVKGACGCFVGYSGPDKVLPGSQERFALKFLRATFNKKTGTTLIIETNDGIKQFISLRVLPNDQIDTSYSFFPTNFLFGGLTSDSLTEKRFVSYLIVPAESPAFGEAVEIFKQSEKMQTSIEKESPLTLLGRSYRVWKMTTKVKEVPSAAGHFSEVNNIHLRSQKSSIFSISIEGVIIPKSAIPVTE